MQRADDPRLRANELISFTEAILGAIGCGPAIAAEMAAHLVEADLAGVYSHGVVRLTQYADAAAAGRFDPAAAPRLTVAAGGAPLVDGGNGFGVPALRLATETAIAAARAEGLAAVGVAEVDHTGRIGAFVETAAEAGQLAILIGGGGRAEWRQVAPYGGAQALLPTNPYAIGIPGGERGPVTIDFATSAASGGKILAARAAGRAVAEGLIVDAEGRPSTDPDAYFSGGALLPAAGPKGYGMAALAELVGEAIFGRARSGMNWLLLTVDLARFRGPSAYRAAAEACLAEIRSCPPAPGFDRVEVPGERERRLRAENLAAGVPLPARTLEGLSALARRLSVPQGPPSPL
ncbi:MAG: Ldh family oxidoreductase [Pseudomonadota bacterium]